MVGMSRNEISPRKEGYESLPVFYAVSGTEKLTEEQRNTLNSVLGIDELDLYGCAKNVAYVLPRPGMKTPSGSKMENVLSSCGLPPGLLVERILRYKIPEGATARDVGGKIGDRMQQVVRTELEDVTDIFKHSKPSSIKKADVLNGGIEALREFNASEKFGLNEDQLKYLYEVFVKYGRNPTDLELMSFAQANSEHCRHGTFNALFTIDGQEQEKTMFQLIKATHNAQIAVGNWTTRSAYSDNAAVFE